MIFLDSNIFFNNWYLNGPNFKYLFNYLENTGSKIIISRLVLEEVDNKQKIGLEELRKNFENNIRKGESLLNTKLTSNLNTIKNNYSIKRELSKKTENYLILGYENIENSVLVERAIKKIRPFQDNEKGFRDTLIWLSLLNYIKESNFEEFIFISNNSNDFYNFDKTNFHQNLIDDIKKNNISTKIKTFSSLKSFFDSEIDIDNHIFTLEEVSENFISPHEEDIEELFVSNINSNEISWFSKFIKSDETYKNINYITDYSITIVEGIEDPEIENWKVFQKKELFVELSLIIRIADIHIKIPKQVYLSNEKVLKEKSYTISFDNEFVKIWFTRRLSVNLSVTFDIKTRELYSLTTNEIVMLK